MPLFKINKQQLSLVKQEKIDLEKDIQSLTEKNLEEIFNLDFVSSEFTLKNFRIDTLAYDSETGSFVIIEFKRSSSFSVVDQGFAYLSLMLNNKDSFVLEYARQKKVDVNQIKIDWSQSRVMFVAGSFTAYQMEAVNFRDLPIELWEVKKYDNATILYNEIKSKDKVESIKTISKNEEINEVSKEIKLYTVDDHFKGKESRDLYEEFKEKIFDLYPELEEGPRKVYIGYKINSKILFELVIQKSRLVLVLSRVQPKDLKDPAKQVSYREKSMEYYHKHESMFYINNSSDVVYAISLVKQLYEKFGG